MIQQTTTTLGVNQAYYDSMPPGLENYWNLMAAPLFRVKTLGSLILNSGCSSVADLGCGNGRFLVELRRLGFRGRQLGVDLSPGRVSENEKLLPLIEWRAANLDVPQEWPQASGSCFDAVVASELIEHLENPAAMLANAASLAVPGRGLLLLSTQSGPIGATERFVGHHRHFAPGEIDMLLRSTGWDPVRIWNTGFPFHDLSKWFASLRPAGMIDRFSNRSYGRAERLVCWALRVLFRLNSETRGAQLFAVARRSAAGALGG